MGALDFRCTQRMGRSRGATSSGNGSFPSSFRQNCNSTIPSATRVGNVETHGRWTILELSLAISWQPPLKLASLLN
jgi:hypothetical protein